MTLGDTDLVGVTPAVLDGVAGVREQFPGHAVEVTADGSGGAMVIVNDVPTGRPSGPNGTGAPVSETGGPYLEPTTWMGFQINAAYPMSDVYPHFVGRLQRVDGAAHGEGFAETTWQDRPALQLSRKSNRWDPTMDTAALKAMKVLAWLAAR